MQETFQEGDVTLGDPFPQGDTWETLRTHLRKTLSRSWAGVSAHDINDAVGHAVLDLWERWADYESSLTTNRGRNYAYAFLRGRHKANEYLRDVCARGEMEIPYDPHSAYWLTLGGIGDDDYPSLSHDDVEYLSRYADPGDLERWILPMVNGETVSSQARREGLTTQAITLRRGRGVARLKRRMESMNSSPTAITYRQIGEQEYEATCAGVTVTVRTQWRARTGNGWEVPDVVFEGRPTFGLTRDAATRQAFRRLGVLR